MSRAGRGAGGARRWAGAAARGLGRFSIAPVRDVRSAALRVAMVATAIVSAAYVVIAAAVLLIVTRNLTAAVDTRVQDQMNQDVGLSSRTLPSTFNPASFSLQEPLLTWVVLDTGEVAAGDPMSRHETLPVGARSLSAPTTIRLADGTDLRASGVRVQVSVQGSLHPARLIVGQSMANVGTTQRNILTAELLIGPLLLIAVGLGAYTVGRRVASPIERARQRLVALTADASHELRTPLSVIEAQTSLALERERDAQWYREAFAAVGVESKRMRKLVDDLLWLARFDATLASPGAEPVDLGVLADQATRRFAAVAELRHQSLRVTVEPVSTVINAPPEWLDRLLGVLLDNACRYTPAGGSIEVTIGRRDGRVRLAVDDSGPGIPVDQRAHIFDRFRRASDLPGGSGLGLAIAAAVVSGSGGRWDVGSSPAGGASMAVSWSPLVRGSASVDTGGAVDAVLAPRPASPAHAPVALTEHAPPA